MTIFWERLLPGCEIRVVAPSRSMSIIKEDVIRLAQERLEHFWYKVSFSKNCREIDGFKSSSIQSRVEDLHEAFLDPKVSAILTTIGWFNSNQLLDHLDYDLIRRNPKILCGYSDITALANAITTKTGLVTYSGPHFSTWGMKLQGEYNFEYFQKCVAQSSPYQIFPSATWSDDAWFLNQENRVIEQNEGYIAIQEWTAEGVVYWGNLCTINLLQGTQYMPDISNSILFLEDDDLLWDFFDLEFDRNLQSIAQLPAFQSIRGIVFGRFQKKAKINKESFRQIIWSKPIPKNIPIIANADFGHTNPLMTFPIGGKVRVAVCNGVSTLEVLEH